MYRRYRDRLISAGVKQSDFPNFMMPFFALRLVESRLLRDIVIDKAKFNKNQYFKNSVFVETNGMDYNSQLYALSKIESLLCNDSHIHYGNTLTDIVFGGQRFDIVVANPPYGLTWNGFKKEIEGNKRNTMNDHHRARIVEALHQFRDSDIAKVYDKWFCYYNKFSIYSPPFN